MVCGRRREHRTENAQTSEVDLSRFRAHGGQLGAWSETAPMQARREFLSRNPLATKDQVGNAVSFMPRAVIASNPLGPSASGSAAQCPDSVIRTEPRELPATSRLCGE